MKDDDPRIESISDNFLKYFHSLMTNSPEDHIKDALEVFQAVARLIKEYVRKFSRMSKCFLDKIFHLVLVASQHAEAFLYPMLNLFLETLKIVRPLST